MFPRDLSPPASAFFLFGPRGTGKSTWIRSRFDDALVVNLLPPEDTVRYERDPAQFRAEVLARPKTDWIVVDEVQRAPKLLDEVHFLMEEKGYRKLVLTGSSARKLRRGSANLLAGRAVLRKLFPLTAAETGFGVPISQRLHYGSMPLSVTARNDRAREDFLRAYTTTYLAEEVRADRSQIEPAIPPGIHGGNSGVRVRRRQGPGLRRLSRRQRTRGRRHARASHRRVLAAPPRGRNSRVSDEDSNSRVRLYLCAPARCAAFLFAPSS